MTKIAQIGCGYWGKNLARNFAEIGALSCVVDGDPETVKNIAEQNGVGTSTFEDVLANPEIQGVSFATPAETHAELAIQSLNAGKHVFVEKPLALNTGDARLVINAAKENNRILMVGHLLQYHPIFMRMRHEINAGLIGDLRYVYSNRLSLGKFRLEENVLWSFAPHDFSMILSLANSNVTEVCAQSASFIVPGIADYVTTQIAFENGVKGHVLATWLHPFKEHRLVAVGSDGMMVFEDSNPNWHEKLAFYNHKIKTTDAAPVPEKSDAEFILVENGEPLKNECLHFVECIESSKVPNTDGLEALNVLDVLERAQSQLKD